MESVAGKGMQQSNALPIHTLVGYAGLLQGHSVKGRFRVHLHKNLRIAESVSFIRRGSRGRYDQVLSMKRRAGSSRY